LEAGVARINFEYGGKTPDVTRVLYTHGSFSGWRKLAAESDLGPTTPVLIIEGLKNENKTGIFCFNIVVLQG
jgi:hypothetical protein